MPTRDTVPLEWPDGKLSRLLRRCQKRRRGLLRPTIHFTDVFSNPAPPTPTKRTRALAFLLEAIRASDATATTAVRRRGPPRMDAIFTSMISTRSG
jgi:hypothetical protein